ncbi:hypothetical protein [Amycolatopsis keratiniphila]|uniref:hypothetical protein n=1 Tax=Amycolatopsis keratiniphila TaxID=129921 RepID=UPI0008799525|nr:hypothetical protein [Amycolatopsis keratiniphila]OLZ47278.1 hypothetical protein BS330_35025 [Amycolatopsis keratiniphila subsp. nogabecina]SDU38403.1 hypothetical protein SAMN04489733_3614 [Amycolatopsis keratiniphila]
MNPASPSPPPRLLRRRRGLRSVVVGDTLVLGGSVAPVRLSGKSATTCLPALLGALDGSRGVRELSEAIGVLEHDVELMLSLLGRHGAVESVATASAPDFTEGGFFASVAGHRADSRSGDELRDCFAAITVEVAGEDAFAAKVREAAATRGPRRPSSGTLVVGGSTAELAARRLAGSAILPVRAAGDDLVIGPVVRPGATPCPHCVTEDTDEPSALPDRYRELAAAFVAARIPVLAIARHDDVAWSEHIDFASGRTRLVARASRPGCPDCSVLRGIAPRPASAAVRYEATLGRVAPSPGPKAHAVEWPLARRVPAVGVGAPVQRVWAGNPVTSLRCHVLAPGEAGAPRAVFGVVRDAPELALLSTVTSSAPAMVVLTGTVEAAMRWSGNAALHELLVEAGWAIEVLREALGDRAAVLDGWSGDQVAWLPAVPEREPVLAVLEIEEVR